jgi:hypothetical protein
MVPARQCGEVPLHVCQLAAVISPVDEVPLRVLQLAAVTPPGTRRPPEAVAFVRRQTAGRTPEREKR